MTAINTLPWASLSNASEVQVALEALFAKLRTLETSSMADAELVPLALSLKYAGDYSALVHAEIENRVLTLGRLIPGAATKDGIVHRIWSNKEAATELARTELGDDAFTKPELKSPAAIEKLGPKGKAFVALASEKPPAPKKVVY